MHVRGDAPPHFTRTTGRSAWTTGRRRSLNVDPHQRANRTDRSAIGSQFATLALLSGQVAREDAQLPSLAHRATEPLVQGYRRRPAELNADAASVELERVEQPVVVALAARQAERGAQ